MMSLHQNEERKTLILLPMKIQQRGHFMMVNLMLAFYQSSRQPPVNT